MDSRARDVVSVIIPTYQRAARVCTAVESALGQTWPSIEVIIVDDGSTDHTAEVVTSKYGADGRVRYIRRSNGGAAAARNTGLEAATGSMIAFLDSDDAWLPWKLELQMACLRARPDAGMTWTDFEAVDGLGRRIAERYLRQMYRTMREVGTAAIFSSRSRVGSAAPRDRRDLAQADLFSGDIYLTMLLGSIVHTSTVLLRREIADSVGPFDESLRPNGEDYDFHLRVCRLTPAVFIDTPTVSYRVGGDDQLTAPPTMVQLARNALKSVERELSDRDERVSRQWARRALGGARSWLGSELLHAGDHSAARIELLRALALGRGRRTWRQLAAASLPSVADRWKRRKASSEGS